MEKSTTSSENVPDATIPPGTAAGACSKTPAVDQLSLQRIMEFLGPEFVQLPPAPQPPIVPEDLLGLGLEQPDKRLILGNIMFWLALHKDCCLGRPEHRAAYPDGCKLPICLKMIELAKHWKQCTGDQCVVTNCTLTKRIISHCAVCTLNRCSVCDLHNYRRYHPQKPTGSTLTSIVVKGATTSAAKSPLMSSRQMQPAVLDGRTLDKTEGCASSVDGVKAAVPVATPMRQEHTEPPPAVVMYNLDGNQADIDVFRASHDLFGSLRAASSPTGPELLPPQRWHAGMAISDLASAISLRSDKMRKLVDALCPNHGSSDAGDPRMATLILYAQKVEAKIYQRVTSEGEYNRVMATKIDTAPQELETKRKRILELCQLRTPNQTTLPKEQLACAGMGAELFDCGNPGRDMSAVLKYWTEVCKLTKAADNTDGKQVHKHLPEEEQNQNKETDTAGTIHNPAKFFSDDIRDFRNAFRFDNWRGDSY